MRPATPLGGRAGPSDAHVVRETVRRLSIPQDVSCLECQITTNVALNASRHRRYFEWLPLNHVDPEVEASADGAWRPSTLVGTLPSDDFAATVAEREAVWAVLAELPSRWRALLLLQAVAGFEVGEIGAMLEQLPGRWARHG